MNDTALYTIGELARRTGLSVKTIRFYSDSGVVAPTDRTHAGYRRYDVTAISRLELVRTLRELGAGLTEIRAVLASETTLSRVATRHVELLERQLRLLRTRRAVLRAVVNQNSTTEEAKLMNKLANMSDAERNRLIDEFWDTMTQGLDLDPGYEAWIRSAKPNLPDNPSSEQVEAWIELAELVQSEDFREVVRSLYKEQAERHQSGEDTGPQTPESAGEWLRLMGEIREQYEAGTSPDSEQARELAGRMLTGMLDRMPSADETELRRSMAAKFEHYDQRVERYWELIYTINGWPSQPMLGPAGPWLAEALRAS